MSEIEETEVQKLRRQRDAIDAFTGSFGYSGISASCPKFIAYKKAINEMAEEREENE